MAKKLWRVSRILGSRSPFDSELLQHTEAQLDFILEMYAAENPDAGRFHRPGQEPVSVAAADAAAWERVLIGDARNAMMNKHMPSEAVLAKLQQLQQREATAKQHAKPKIRMGSAAKRSEK